MSRSLRCFIAVLALSLVAGCSKPYVVTRPLDHTLEPPITIGVGAITDDLPAEMPDEKKPTSEDLDKLRRYLEEEIGRRELWRLASEPGDSLAYEVRASLLEYKRGSGALRFLIGFGAGNAKATMSLKLVDMRSGDVVFAGNFYRTVSHWAEGGDQMFRRIADDFAKELERQLKSRRG